MLSESVDYINPKFCLAVGILQILLKWACNKASVWSSLLTVTSLKQAVEIQTKIYYGIFTPVSDFVNSTVKYLEIG